MLKKFWIWIEIVRVLALDRWSEIIIIKIRNLNLNKKFLVINLRAIIEKVGGRNWKILKIFYQSWEVIKLFNIKRKLRFKWFKWRGNL